MFRRRRTTEWTLEDVAPLEGTPLLKHATRLIAAHGDGPLPGGGWPLPDEPPRDPSKVQYMAGLLDGIGSAGDTQPALLAAAAVLDQLRSEPSTDKVHLVADRLDNIEGAAAFDTLLESLRAGKADRFRLARLARWLCTHGTKRQQVKAALAIIGAAGTPDDLDLVNTLGRLEVLTLYALVAVSNIMPAEAEQAVFALARQVEGWGRIHAFYRLAGTDDPEIKEWMLRGGYASGVLDEEVAFIAADTGDLVGALRGEPDEGLLDWCGRLLVALARGGPAKDMSDYTDGVDAIGNYLRHIGTVAPTLDRLHHLYDLEQYLTGWASNNPHIDAETRARLAGRFTALLDRPGWAALVEGGLASDDVAAVKHVLRLASRFGLDPTPVARAWLPRQPHDLYLWQAVLAAASDDDIDELVELRRQVLPWSAVKTGPANDMGGGPSYRADSCFDMILQWLRKFPGHGWEAISLGLTCRVTRNRNMALAALAEWPRNTWPDSAEDELRRLLFLEPNDKTRKRVRDLLTDTAAPETAE